MKNIIIKPVISGIVFCLTIVVFYVVVKARTGITSSPGDKITSAKWNELVTQLSTLSGQVNPSTARTAIPSQGNWTSSLSCRRIGNIIQFNGYISNSTAQAFWGASGFTIPEACRPSITILHPPATCRNNSSVVGRCFSALNTNGVLSFYTQDTMANFSLGGTYPAN